MGTTEAWLMHVGISFQSYTNGLSRPCFSLGLPSSCQIGRFKILGLLYMDCIYLVWGNDLVWDNCYIMKLFFFPLGIILWYLELSWKFYARRVAHILSCFLFKVLPKTHSRRQSEATLWEKWVKVVGNCVHFCEHNLGNMRTDPWLISLLDKDWTSSLETKESANTFFLKLIFRNYKWKVPVFYWLILLIVQTRKSG